MEHDGHESKGITPTKYERTLLQQFYGEIPVVITWNILVPMLMKINDNNCCFNIYSSRTDGHILYAVVVWEGDMDQIVVGYEEWESNLIQRAYKSILGYINWSQNH